MNSERFAALAWIVLGASMAVGALNFGLGKMGMPGIGFMPFLIGVCLAGSGLILFFANGRKEGGEAWKGQKWQPLALTFGVFLAYILVLDG